MTSMLFIGGFVAAIVALYCAAIVIDRGGAKSIVIGLAIAAVPVAVVVAFDLHILVRGDLILAIGGTAGAGGGIFGKDTFGSLGWTLLGAGVALSGTSVIEDGNTLLGAALIVFGTSAVSAGLSSVLEQDWMGLVGSLGLGVGNAIMGLVVLDLSGDQSGVAAVGQTMSAIGLFMFCGAIFAVTLGAQFDRIPVAAWGVLFVGLAAVVSGTGAVLWALAHLDDSTVVLGYAVLVAGFGAIALGIGGMSFGVGAITDSPAVRARANLIFGWGGITVGVAVVAVGIALMAATLFEPGAAAELATTARLFAGAAVVLMGAARARTGWSDLHAPADDFQLSPGSLGRRGVSVVS